MAKKITAALATKAASLGPEIPTPEARQWLPAEYYTTLWESYERSGAVHKRRAEAAFAAVVAFADLVDNGRSNGEAERAVASHFGVSRATLYRYRNAIKGHPRMHWLPLLAPHYKGGRPCAPFTEAAYAYILGKHKNTSEIVTLERAFQRGQSQNFPFMNGEDCFDGFQPSADAFYYYFGDLIIDSCLVVFLITLHNTNYTKYKIGIRHRQLAPACSILAAIRNCKQ